LVNYIFFTQNEYIFYALDFYLYNPITNIWDSTKLFSLNFFNQMQFTLTTLNRTRVLPDIEKYPPTLLLHSNEMYLLFSE